MVSAGTFCDETHVAAKAKNMSADIDNGDTDETDVWIVDAESIINCITRFNWTDVFSALNDDVKMILRDTASSLAVIMAVTYDMAGFTSRVEAEDIINIQRDRVLFNLAILRDQKVKKFIEDG